MIRQVPLFVRKSCLREIPGGKYVKRVTRDERIRCDSIIFWYSEPMQEAWLCSRKEISLRRWLIPPQVRPVAYGEPLDKKDCIVVIHLRGTPRIRTGSTANDRVRPTTIVPCGQPSSATSCAHLTAGSGFSRCMLSLFACARRLLTLVVATVPVCLLLLKSGRSRSSARTPASKHRAPPSLCVPRIASTALTSRVARPGPCP